MSVATTCTGEQLHQKFHDKDWDGLAQIFKNTSESQGEGLKDLKGLKDLLLHRDKNNCNALHLAGIHEAPAEIVSKILDVGGRDLNKDADGERIYRVAVSFVLLTLLTHA